MANPGEKISDTTLLYSKIDPLELQNHTVEFGLAYKEYRLNDKDKLRFARILLRSPYSHDYYKAIQIFIELIQNADEATTQDEDFLEYFIGLAIGYYKTQDYEKAIFNVEECQRRLRLDAEELERLNSLKSIFRNRNRFRGYGIATMAAAAGAVALFIFAKK